ncbi:MULTISPECIES: cbb3-type cytochrome oxidase assembly protein CcoS [Leptospira]|uniref:Cytochrome oxidase maturation protein n=4 Tax=Leptospira TaxID=171 RepID=A0A2P2CY16_9LEPT|nr:MULTISPECIES: cbb3-type cytochrome oxidase assembly protein CcoS [Leptospira]EIE00382.1 cytochrome oxidase maturation protein, cbb3-type [Leptospira licerasiae serovar Varillal str. VAR 010]EJZ43615.1 cytochrome oxidase maturation protein, cbb3-type [Leptospira licerasiae str. MMD4847]PJZ26376.1 cbb3-type cytochrome oxidase assembly protein CcoS [Leptospira hartskeerlii]PJZ34461.1 cbb3-type cytochrome oxidase assembly protein CcoS [Leptospira hartskeerlii]TGM86681.1 cbb3-type cytochrome oxi
MNALYLTIPIALVISFGAFYVFLLNFKSGQYEDIEGPKYRMLFEEDKQEKSN